MTEILNSKFGGRLERALYCDAYVKDFDRRFADWTTLAACLIEVERDELWTEFADCDSYDDWLHKRAPVSHSLCYAVKARMLNLQQDFTLDEMKLMPPQTAEYIKKHVPPAVRKDPRAREASTKKQKEAVEQLQRDFPLHAFEAEQEITLHFEKSAWEETIAPEVEIFRQENDAPKMRLEDVIEGVFAERRMARQMSEEMEIKA
jgi:hypothetical protein